MVLKGIMLILLFGVIPEFVGLLMTSCLKKEKSIFLNYIYGILSEFAVLQILAIPMIFTKCKFSTMANTWFCIIIGLTIISLILNIKKIKEILKSNIEEIKKLPIITILVVILVGFQTFMLTRYAHIDDDDAFYVATATVTIQKDTMYLSCSEDGGYYGGFPARYVLSPFPMYTSVISYFSKIHPAIVAHTIFPLVFIPIAYIVYGLLASKLFNKDKKSIMTFLTILSFVYIFGNYSIRSNFTFLLFRIWQGKAILANIILPFIWYTYLECMENNKLINWISLFLVALSACLVSSMSIVLIPMTVVLLGFVFSIKEKKISNLIKSFATICPCLIYATIYLFIR